MVMLVVLPMAALAARVVVVVAAVVVVVTFMAAAVAAARTPRHVRAAPAPRCSGLPPASRHIPLSLPPSSPHSSPPLFPRFPCLQQGMCALPLPHVAVDFRLPPAIPLSVDMEERDDGTLPAANQQLKPRYIHINSIAYPTTPSPSQTSQPPSYTHSPTPPLPTLALPSPPPPSSPALPSSPHAINRASTARQTQRCGWGAMAAEPIKAGEFIVEYAGEGGLRGVKMGQELVKASKNLPVLPPPTVIDDAMCEARLWAMRAGGATDFYMCEVSRDVVIDATFRGGHGRFVNHSCAPNAELQKWLVEGHVRVGIFAIKDIAVGTEVAYDYSAFESTLKCIPP
ncbi:unnamed protein product [Closterium sp. Naga37s-1]|nr:unnamed protein product [Closterium sp. Naga37s-1]